MLAGVGGWTISEAKERMSYAEAVAWFSYIRQRGSLNVGRRIEHAAALIATVVNRSAGGSAEMKDFLSHEDTDEMDISSVMKILGGAK